MGERRHERESWPEFDPNPTRTRTHDLDPVGSPISGHRSGQAWHRFEAWETSNVSMPSLSPETDQNVGNLSSKVAAKARFRHRWSRRIFWCTTTWNWFLTSPASFSDWPRPLGTSKNRRTTTRRLADVRASIHRRQRAWKVTANTVGLSVAWTFSSELSVAVGWIPVTVDRQGYFGNFSVQGQICNFKFYGYFNNYWNWGQSW